MAGKILLVTGGSSDVGKVLIEKVAENYEFIWVHYYKNEEIVNELKQEYGSKILPVQADFADLQSVENMIQNIKASEKYPDHIVHLSAPKTFNQKFTKCDWKDFQEGIDTSLRSIVEITKAFVPSMAKRKYGKIVFMLSSCVIGTPPKYQSPYITVKYALLGLMNVLASEYADKGITVNAVSPDMIETKFLDNIPELIVSMNAEKSPLKRNLTVEDVVPSFEFLLSQGADTITGQNIGIATIKA